MGEHFSCFKITKILFTKCEHWFMGVLIIDFDSKEPKQLEIISFHLCFIAKICLPKPRWSLLRFSYQAGRTAQCWSQTFSSFTLPRSTWVSLAPQPSSLSHLHVFFQALHRLEASVTSAFELLPGHQQFSLSQSSLR